MEYVTELFDSRLFQHVPRVLYLIPFANKLKGVPNSFYIGRVDNNSQFHILRIKPVYFISNDLIIR